MEAAAQNIFCIYGAAAVIFHIVRHRFPTAITPDRIDLLNS